MNADPVLDIWTCIDEYSNYKKNKSKGENYVSEFVCSSTDEDRER